jgi:hypothetical protein
VTTPGFPRSSQDSVNAEIQRLRQKIEELARRTLGQTAISSPGDALTISGGAELSVLHDVTNALIFHVGHGTGGKYFVTIRRDDGTPVFEVGIDGSLNQFGALWDRTGHVIVSDDSTSGAGMARPWLAMPGVPVLATSIPMTNSGTYVSTWGSGDVIKQQPYCRLQALVRTESGATGNARFTINGAAVGTVMAMGANQFAWQTAQDIALPGAIDATERVELQVQRTNASGTIGGVFIWTQRQSP